MFHGMDTGCECGSTEITEVMCGSCQDPGKEEGGLLPVLKEPQRHHPDQPHLGNEYVNSILGSGSGPTDSRV